MSIVEKLTTIAENEQKVFDAGKQTEYDVFWDIYQTKGNRTDYRGAFSGLGWTDDTFKPKYDIKVNGNAQNLFMGSYMTNIKKTLSEQNVKLDISGATTLNYAFGSTITTELPFLDISKGNNTDYMFYYNNLLETIDGIKFGEANSLTGFVSGCSKLKNLIASGIIAKSISFSACTLLTAESIRSIVNCLSSTVTGQTLTLSQTATNNAFTTEEWNELIADKTNWTISLV